MQRTKGIRRLCALTALSIGTQLLAPGQALVDSGGSTAALPNFLPAIAPAPKKRIEQETKTVNWNGLFAQSALFLGIEHAFRWSTERGTREMKGPFVAGYFNSLGNMHGWSDGDPFYVNYVGHAMQGAVSGFIWTQNDHQFRDVEFGRDRRYWKSRLRAAAWSFLYSTQFEIGPVSEASIGHIQNSYPQQGFVDLAITPTVGMGWLIAEDALDKYLVRPFEDRVSNPYARIFVRGWLNPARSLSNAIRLRVPWHRDNREGVYTYIVSKPRPKTPEVEPAPENYPLVAPFELAIFARAQRFVGTDQTCVGGGANSGLRVSSDWQIVIDVSGCNLIGLGDSHVSGDSLSYLIGPRWSAMAAKRWSFYAELLIGGNKITNETVDLDKKAVFDSDPKNMESRRPPSAEFADSKESNNFMISAAAGVDVRLTRALAFRVAQLGYMHSWTNDVSGIRYANALHLSSGLILRIGTW